MAELAQREVSSIGLVAANILKDTEKLVRQEFDLFEAKLKRDVEEKIASGVYVTFGLMFAFFATVCAVGMLVSLGTHLGLPLWASFGLTALVSAAAGTLTFIARGKYGRQREKT